MFPIKSHLPDIIKILYSDSVVSFSLISTGKSFGSCYASIVFKSGNTYQTHHLNPEHPDVLLRAFNDIHMDIPSS